MSPIILDQPALNTSGIHPALRNFADECSAVAVRILAYVCGLAVLAVIAVDLFSAVPVAANTDTPALPGWTPASRPHPAFAISKLDLSDRPDAYEILRHPEGGRRDILRWAASAGEAPTAEIEIYRPGGELDAFTAADAGLAARMAGQPATEVEPAGVLETKFGRVALLRLSGAALPAKQTCLGFVKTFTAPNVTLSGWSCQAGSLAAQKTFLGCTLNRLTLLSAGNDPKMAELFARAELRRDTCNMTTATATNWIAAGDTPPLRGRLAQD
ncbi:hypothetical protein [Bradyrhizobium sp. G127]|jgi:hypothetical protein|uniref:hypothetical protein n=1 Tax=Bradyrhizobium sp. G127 TaxID=2904800 RepID=UPI001F3E64D4|nr:hypothetical protein [Bradyrhizobium sp. G127]MCF2521419.1 hypothetical protein [Bradyrhizobium sp. G127]